MIQVHGKTILSMKFNPIIKAHGSSLWQIIHQSLSPIILSNILSKAQYNLAIFWKAHDSSPWQSYFINGIQSHNQSPWFKPMANYLSKPKPNNAWQYLIKSPIQHFKRPMIQVHSKVILSMEFNLIIKAHGSNPWQII